MKFILTDLKYHQDKIHGGDLMEKCHQSGSLSEITNFLHDLKFIYQIQKLKSGVNPLYQQRKEK